MTQVAAHKRVFAKGLHSHLISLPAFIFCITPSTLLQINHLSGHTLSSCTRHHLKLYPSGEHFNCSTIIRIYWRPEIMLSRPQPTIKTSLWHTKNSALHTRFATPVWECSALFIYLFKGHEHHLKTQHFLKLKAHQAILITDPLFSCCSDSPLTQPS